jgi:hypothetical protein
MNLNLLNFKFHKSRISEFPESQNPRIPESRIPESRIQNLRIQNPRIQNPESQNPESRISESRIPESRIPESRIQNPESQNPESRISESRIQNPRIPESQNPQNPRISESPESHEYKINAKILWRILDNPSYLYPQCQQHAHILLLFDVIGQSDPKSSIAFVATITSFLVFFLFHITKEKTDNSVSDCGKTPNK